MKFKPAKNISAGHLTDTVLGDGVLFPMGFPEAIGDIEAPRWTHADEPVDWSMEGDSVHVCRGSFEGALDYVMRVEPAEFHCDVTYLLTNRSTKSWRRGMAFNCFNCSFSPQMSDHEGFRNHLGVGGRPRPMTECPRVHSHRPGVQLYSVVNQPAGADLPFVAGFQATPQDFAVSPWMIMESVDGQVCAAIVSQPGLFLFQNSEYSCIHSATGFPATDPGETHTGRTRVYVMPVGVDEMARRLEEDPFG